MLKEHSDTIKEVKATIKKISANAVLIMAYEEDEAEGGEIECLVHGNGGDLSLALANFLIAEPSLIKVFNRAILIAQSEQR